MFVSLAHFICVLFVSHVHGHILKLLSVNTGNNFSKYTSELHRVRVGLAHRLEMSMHMLGPPF
jgi:hypothetical protein